jgi:Protein of unknown function (DUF3455)
MDVMIKLFTCLAMGLAALPAHAEVIELQARGVQIYVCERTSDAFAWRLKAPEATLFDAAGAEAGRHFAGPSWQAKDGSTVVGEALVSSQPPTEGSIPWVVLHAKSHEGSGRFAGVEYIVRLHTEGGVAPTAGCDQSLGGAESRVGYRAVYVLFSR